MNVSEDKFEQYLINEMKNQINDNKLTISYKNDLQSIEFINNFDIDELKIQNCANIIPQLNHNKIKKLELIQCRTKCLKDLQLPNLETLTVLENLYEEEAVTIENFGQFQKLEELKLQCYEYLNLKLICELQLLQLTKLELAACNLTNIELLTQFQQVSSLSLQFNPEIDIRPLSQMIQLTKLILSKCCLKNIDSLKSLVKLQDLDLAYNYNIDIYPVQFLKLLTKLILTNCSLNDLTYLKPLVNLKNLNIASNNIIYLEPLEKLNQIEKLNVVQNRIQDLQVLHNHHNFASYEVSYQSEANQKQIRVANQLRDINCQITSLRNIDKIKSNMKNKITMECCKVEKCLQQIYNIYNQFSGYVASLIQQLNQYQDLQ
ncbi:DUF2252_family protein [Hexamita inflata]|uniref:DUF2252 family protein n=1 Tax=Hexamita inflata TaxID=28002 RepID=A0AA86U7B3_9EUKA|nr:DUF2252 family protein [Hexamita inflata]